MKQEYIQSVEEYKGFVLKIQMYCLTEMNDWHRRCQVWKNGKHIAICKTKKEAKDMINHGCWQNIKNN